MVFIMKQLNIGISTTKLASLIQQGHLCAADLQCLDKQTKQQVWQLCLWACKKRIGCTKDCANCYQSNAIQIKKHVETEI